MKTKDCSCQCSNSKTINELCGSVEVLVEKIADLQVELDERGDCNHQQILLDVIKWHYTHDGVHPSKQAWREGFVRMLEHELGLCGEDCMLDEYVNEDYSDEKCDCECWPCKHTKE